MHIILAIKCPLPTCYICIRVTLLQHQTSCGHVINIYVYMSRNAGQKHKGFFTSKSDFGVKVPPQTCQQSIFRILIATQINPRDKRLALLNMNKRPGLLLYNFAISRHTGTVSVRPAVIFYMLKLSTVSRIIEPFASRCEYSQTV